MKQFEILYDKALVVLLPEFIGERVKVISGRLFAEFEDLHNPGLYHAVLVTDLPEGNWQITGGLEAEIIAVGGETSLDRPLVLRRADT